MKIHQDYKPPGRAETLICLILLIVFFCLLVLAGFEAAAQTVNFREPGAGLQVPSGQGTSNSFLGGTWHCDYTIYTNHSTVGAFTNFANVTVPAHSLTNLNDMLTAQWSGFFMPGTNHLQFGYGSITNIMDSGAQTNGQPSAWGAWMTVTRRGNTSEHVEGEIYWNPGFGAPFSRTNFNLEIAETNGIPNVLKAAGRTLAGRAFGITNNSFRVCWDPSSH